MNPDLKEANKYATLIKTWDCDYIADLRSYFLLLLYEIEEIAEALKNPI